MTGGGRPPRWRSHRRSQGDYRPSPIHVRTKDENVKRNELNTKWLEALRSGKYKQGQGYLQTIEGYCCLGVARVAVFEGKTDTGETELSYDEDEKLGLTCVNWEDKEGKWHKSDVSTCVSMNDTYNKSFAFIADVIEYAIENDIDLDDAFKAIEANA